MPAAFKDAWQHMPFCSNINSPRAASVVLYPMAGINVPIRAYLAYCRHVDPSPLNGATRRKTLGSYGSICSLTAISSSRLDSRSNAPPFGKCRRQVRVDDADLLQRLSGSTGSNISPLFIVGMVLDSGGEQRRAFQACLACACYISFAANCIHLFFTSLLAIDYSSLPPPPPP